MDLASTSTRSIEDKVDAVAKAVGDVGEPMGGVMGVCDSRAIGISYLSVPFETLPIILEQMAEKGSVPFIPFPFIPFYPPFIPISDLSSFAPD